MNKLSDLKWRHKGNSEFKSTDPVALERLVREQFADLDWCISEIEKLRKGDGGMFSMEMQEARRITNTFKAILGHANHSCAFCNREDHRDAERMIKELEDFLNPPNRSEDE